ncbi:MAG: acetyl-CoA decarbonylase/synthase complex subunit alpha, partial [Candidatus Altarchaeaceae archaeon]
RFEKERAKLSPGRGAIQDVEIRTVGAPIVTGEIPGVIAAVGCSLYPRSGKELVEIAEEFISRGYIFVTSGCAAMTLGIESVDFDPEGKGRSMYEIYPGEFNKGCLVNVGSCVANSHITGAAIKIANIFAKRKLLGNYEEIADYMINRVGAVGLVWGTMSTKALAIGNGAMRLGIPVVWGPSGIKYRAQFLSDEKTSWLNYESYGKGENGMIDISSCPEHLSVVAKDVKEAKVLLAKLCFRAADGIKGRTTKLTHYIEIYLKEYGKFPEDVYKFIRSESEIPMTYKDEIMKILKEKNWKEKFMVAGGYGDPTLLKRMVKK